MPFPCVLPGSRVEFCQWCALVRCSLFCLTFLFVLFAPRHHTSPFVGGPTAAGRQWIFVAARSLCRRMFSGLCVVVCHWREYRGPGPARACDVPHAQQLLVLMDVRDCQGTVPVVWLSRRLESVGKRGAWLWNQILFWLTCMVENAVVGMSSTLAEETAVKDPEDDEAFRATDKQMGVEWFDGLRTRQRKRRGLVLSRKLKLRLWQTTDVNRACCQYFFSARAEFAGARMVHIGVDAAFVGGLHRMLGYFTLPFGSGCWAAPTDEFGSIAASSAHKLSCRSDRFTKVYVDAFSANRCLLSLRHINFVFLGVYTNVSPGRSPARKLTRAWPL